MFFCRTNPMRLAVPWKPRASSSSTKTAVAPGCGCGNRRNAQRSTGPRSAAGKEISSRNAFRHGLSLGPDDEAAAKAAIDRIAWAIIDNHAGELKLEDAYDWAAAQLDIRRIQQIRRAVLAGLDLRQANSRQLQLLLSTYRYDHRAQTRRRRAAAKLKGSTPA